MPPCGSRSGKAKSATQVKKRTFHMNCKNIQQIKQIEANAQQINSSEVESVKDKETIPESVLMKCVVSKRRTNVIRCQDTCNKNASAENRRHPHTRCQDCKHKLQHEIR